jgi:hypothetical protein
MLAQINAISRGYGLHLPLVMLDKQGSQIGNWNEEAERNLTTYLNGIEDTSQVLFTVKAYVNLNKNLPQEFKNMVKFIMDKTDCLFHVQIMEYTGTTPGPRYEIEKEERWRGVLALLKTFNTNYPTRLFVSRGNEPFLDGNHEWTDTIESFREWQFAFNETAKELGFKVGISNEASLTNTLETLRVALLQNRPIDLISAHVYRPKTNHPNHVQTFVKSIQHLCMLAKRKVPMIALTENSFTYIGLISIHNNVLLMESIHATLYRINFLIIVMQCYIRARMT